jgi:hypothetical protein
VAFIDARTYQVETVFAGQGPTFLAAIPGDQDRAIVLNVLSNDATLLVRRADGVLEQTTFPVAPGANAWAISPDGHWAIAWTDVLRVDRPDTIEGFQEISLIDLTNPVPPARPLKWSVGFRPSSISFAPASARALAVTQDGITVINLSNPANPQVERTLSLDDAPASDAGGQDADGAAAIPDASGC